MEGKREKKKSTSRALASVGLAHHPVGGAQRSDTGMQREVEVGEGFALRMFKLHTAALSSSF